MSDLDARISQRASELEASDDELECLDDWTGQDCQGDVEYRMPLSGTGKSFARCELHWEARLAEAERMSDYQSVAPPPWFDASYAGERWDDEY